MNSWSWTVRPCGNVKMWNIYDWIIIWIEPQFVFQLWVTGVCRLNYLWLTRWEQHLGMSNASWFSITIYEGGQGNQMSWQASWTQWNYAPVSQHATVPRVYKSPRCNVLHQRNTSLHIEKHLIYLEGSAGWDIHTSLSKFAASQKRPSRNQSSDTILPLSHVV